MHTILTRGELTCIARRLCFKVSIPQGKAVI
jgi:hypothetical protein